MLQIHDEEDLVSGGNTEYPTLDHTYQEDQRPGSSLSGGGVDSPSSSTGNSLLKSPYPCPECDKTFPSPGKLRQHSYSHSGETPFECLEEACDKKFTSRFKLKRHVLIHSQDKQFHCEVCNRPFRRKDHLKNHEKVHSACKTVYTCSHQGCTRNYNSYTSYRKHQAMHSAELGALDCKICHKELVNREALMNHLKVHYGSRKDLKRHSVVHTGDREFPCHHCTQRFGRKDHMVRHAKKSHPLEFQNVSVPQAAVGAAGSVTHPFTTSKIPHTPPSSSTLTTVKTEAPILIKQEPLERGESLIQPTPFIEPISLSSIKTEPPLTFGPENVVSSFTSTPTVDVSGKFPKNLLKKSSPRYSPPTGSNIGYSPVPSPGLAHILYNDSSSEQDLDSFISQLVNDSGSDLPLLRPTNDLSPKVKLEEPSSSSSVSISSKKVPDTSIPNPANRYLRLRNQSSDSVTHTKNPVLPSVYADNALIVPEPSKTKYPSSFQIDSEDSLSDLRALLPDQVFNQL
ncbi:PLAG1 [Lepeophtheirus salmonis]|uniref:PLAG1 n=1 Tax=Lepeophtheirus salmonis TaxID=72036 RepID=A0A7R8H6A4_LEPSM|nr:PLAG1 [Lepeophtheirus salmonis]CAF2893124.1 PLAG1 [Lepeophtheirus salmonis]